jgi:hypothetical protein
VDPRVSRRSPACGDEPPRSGPLANVQVAPLSPDVHAAGTATLFSLSGEYLHDVPLLFDDQLAMAFVSEMYEYTRNRHIEVFGGVDDDIVPERVGIGTCCTPTIIADTALVGQALFPARERRLLNGLR